MISPSSSTESNLSLEGVDLEPMTQRLNKISITNSWSKYVEQDTEGSWDDLLPLAVATVTAEVASVDKLKDKVIEPLSLMKAPSAITKFNDEMMKRWKEGIQRAVAQGDWVDLINLTKRSSNVQKIAMGVPLRLKEAVILAWNQDYYGDHHMLLLDAVDHMKVEPTYVNMLPLVQSSGTGKSRMVDRIAMDQRILIPLCLRENLGANMFAYPLPDDTVRNHFLRAPDASEESCKDYFSKFLSSLFQQLQKESLSFLSSNGATTTRLPYKKIMEYFYNFFNESERRKAFYVNVVKGVATTKQVAETSFKNLEKCLKKSCTNWQDTTGFPILISLDEVHTLYERQPFVSEDTNHTLYSRLSSALSSLVDCNFAVISMSTASHLPSVTPAPDIAPSMRERNKDLFHPAPFVEFPFDIHLITNPLVSGNETLASVGSLEFTARFGRPLFYATFLSRSQTNGSLSKEIISIAKEKLCGHRWPPETAAKLNAATIAILSSRLHLDLSPSSIDAKTYEVELVRNHSRVIYSVHDNIGITIITGSSPEPLLAEASAEMMHYQFERQNYINLWGLLFEYMSHGLADQGATGELIGRALSISAMDQAINSLPVEIRCELPYQTPVTVVQYYQALLDPHSWQKLRKSVPTNRAMLSSASGTTTFEDAFQNAYFHFSHYGKANDASPMQDSCSWAYWLRGTAISCQLNQELTDRMLPIYFPSLGNVGPETMSANLDQDKTSQSAKPHNVSIQSAEDLSIFSKGQKLPYISAVHLYSNSDDKDPLHVFIPEPERDCHRYKEVDEEAPRYQIDFCGLGAYANISGKDKEIIRAMLNHTKTYIFKNHPRPSCVSAVRQMLPVLANDADSTRWFGAPGCGKASGKGKTRKKPAREMKAGTSDNSKGKKRALEEQDSGGSNSSNNGDSNIRKRVKKHTSGELWNAVVQEPARQVTSTPGKRGNHTVTKPSADGLKTSTRRLRSQNVGK